MEVKHPFVIREKLLISTAGRTGETKAAAQFEARGGEHRQ